MKKFILLPALISCFFVSKSIAQKDMAAPMQSSNREVSNYSSNAYSSSGGGVNTTRTESNYSAPAQTVSYRNSTPAYNLNNVNTTYANSNISTSGSVAYSNNYPTGNNPAAIHNTRGVMRYNYADKSEYPYYPSANRRHKDNRPNERIARIDRELNSNQLTPYTSFNDFCNTPIDIGSQTYAAGFTNTNSVLNISLDGYVVYGDDTLSGIVTITPSAVLLEQSIDPNSEQGNKFAYNDNNMKSVVVFNDQQELYLTRTSANDSALLRVLHVGKLNVYDDVYAFPTVQNVDQRNVQFADGDKMRSISSLVVLDWRTPLVRAINKSYGLKLHTMDMSWNKLLLYINTLD